MTTPIARTTPSLPPRWFIRAVWRGHRLLYRLSAGRLGLARPSEDRAGILRLRVIGRSTGIERAVMLCYLEEGSSLVTLAMNGWGDAAPAWWLNLRAHPDAEVDLADGVRRVRARAAVGEERERLWRAVGSAQGWGDDVETLASARSVETPVVVLEPR
jgi:deazaflavin-dependent oxidoreductase (nitroreductase family)